MPIEDLLARAERVGRTAALMEAAALIADQAHICARDDDYAGALVFSTLAQRIMALPTEPPAPTSEAPCCDRPTVQVPGGDGHEPEPFDEFTGPQATS
jgi:hypothetical protein